MPVTTIDYTAAAGASTVTTLDAENSKHGWLEGERGSVRLDDYNSLIP